MIEAMVPIPEPPAMTVGLLSQWNESSLPASVVMILLLTRHHLIHAKRGAC
jgi:hypothetical protein